MDWAGWAIFGLIATAALTAVMIAAQLAGRTRFDLPLMLGTMLVRDPDRARVAGFFMRRHGYPVAPLVVGMILGPMAEEQVRRTLQISEGNLTALVASPFAAVAYGVLLVILVVMVVLRLRRKTLVSA